MGSVLTFMSYSGKVLHDIVHRLFKLDRKIQANFWTASKMQVRWMNRYSMCPLLHSSIIPKELKDFTLKRRDLACS